MTLLLYLGKVLLCSAVLLGYYRLFLQNNQFHQYNRIYLQSTLLLSILLPFIKIPVWQQSQSVVNQAVYKTLHVLTVTYGEQDVMVGAPGLAQHLFSLENILYAVYSIGVLILLGMLIKSLLYIKRLSTKYPYERINGLKFYTTREPGTPFSFFRSVFWNKELSFNSKEGQQIFRHEWFHVQQKHSTDIIIAELVTALFWFNPFFYLLKKELKAVHEFQADQYAMAGADRYTYAELLVIQTLRERQITNYFFQNHIKRRIAMITQTYSMKFSYARRLMALPVLILLAGSIVLKAQPVAKTNVEAAKKPITVVIDAGHGGIDPGAKGNTFAEKDIALQISQKIQQLAAAYNVNVVMTRTTDELPAKATTIEDGLRARTTIATQANAEAYVSIHVSYDPNNNERTGVEIFVPKGHEARQEQSKQLGSLINQSIGTLYTVNPTLLERDKNIWVLERTPCPAVLVECGFINSEKDIAYFTNPDNQEKLARKILEGIVNFKNPPATNNATNGSGRL